MRGVFLTTEWRALLIASLETDPAILQPFLPGGTVLDTRERASREPGGRPVPPLPAPRRARSFHPDFPEVNLRRLTWAPRSALVATGFPVTGHWGEPRPLGRAKERP